MGSMWIILAVVVIASGHLSEALKILGVFPLAGKSHFIPNCELMKGLARRGHQVDVVSHFPLKKPMQNYKDISLEGSGGFSPVNNVSYSDTNRFNQFSMATFAHMTGTEPCNLLSHEALQEVLKTPKNTYDVIVVELFGAQCYLAFAQHLNATLVGVVVSKMHDWLYKPFGVPFNTAYLPSLFSSYSQEMTFLERLKNTALSSIIIPQMDYYLDVQREHVEKYFGRKLSSIAELYNDVAVLLVNSHHSLNGIMPTPPGVVEVGGLHVNDDQQQLAPELKKWLDESKRGFVYISFGSMLRIETFPPKVVGAFYEMAKRIAPVRVLMKIADPKILPPGLPNNVITSSWLPQVAVLKHENIKLFVTHGGQVGTQEAIAHGVPMVGIPIFGDQHTNIQIYERKKIAVTLQVAEITSDSLTKAVSSVLDDPTYRDNMKKISTIFNDRPMSALDTAIYWVEYAARHGKVLQSPAVNLSWWQFYLVDVYGCVLLGLLVALYIIKRVIQLLCRLVGCSKRTPSASKTKKTK